MSYFKSLLKTLLINFLVIIIGSILITLLYYFNIIPNSIYNIFKLILPILSLFFTTKSFAITAREKGYLEGAKIGALTVIIFIIITSLTKQGFNLKMTIYFLLLLITSAFGGMVGINQKEK